MTAWPVDPAQAAYFLATQHRVIKLFQSELCIDNSRIFSVGFSFGAMFTNALAQTHQSTLRGVVVYATADYNIYFPKNTGEPLADELRHFQVSHDFFRRVTLSLTLIGPLGGRRRGDA